MAEGQDAVPECGPEVEGMNISQNLEDEERETSLKSGCNSSSDSQAESYFWLEN